MPAITFDTLKFARRLREAGVPDAQAEAEAEALAEVFADALESQLATKGDTARIEQRITVIEGELKLMKGMLGLIIGGVIALILKAFFV